MNLADLFVGGVTVLLGLSIMATAALNWKTGFQLPQARALEARFGRPRARSILAVVGLLIVALGCLILIGFRPFSQSRHDDLQQRPLSTCGLFCTAVCSREVP